MPTYEIKAPNGKTYRIDGPDGATDEQVQAEVLRQFPEVGGQAAQPQAPAMPAADPTGIPNPAAPGDERFAQTEPQQQADPNAVLTDLWRTGADDNAILTKAGELGLRITDPERLKAMREYEQANPGYYNTAAPFVAGGNGGGVERVEQPGVGETLLNSAAALGGSLFRGVAALPDAALDAGEWLAGMASPNTTTNEGFKAGPRLSNIPDMLGTPRPQAPGAEFAGNVLGGSVIPMPKAPVKPINALAPEAAQGGKAVNALADPQGIIQAGRREGVRVMTSDVSPPKTAISKFIQKTGESIPLTGTAGPRAAQQGERVKAVENLLAEYGATEAKGAASEIAADLVATRGAAIKSLTKAKNSVIDTLPGKVPTPNASKVINEQITRLRGINEEAFAPVIAKLKNFEAQLESGLSLSQVEGNRRLLGDLFADPSLASIKGDGQKALNAIYGPLREDMGAFIKQVGGEGQFNKWKGANDRLAAMAGELDASAFKGALNKAETTPEAAAKLLFSKTPSEVKRLYKNLSPEGRTKAQSAIIYEAMTKAGGAENLSPQKFATAMKAMDDATGIFFAPADKARIDGLTRLLQATQRASEAGALPMTGAQNTIPIIGASLTGLFGGAGGLVSAGGIGVAARLYESAPVRDALLRIGRSKPGSPQEKAATDYAEKMIARVMAKSTPVTADRAGQAVAQSPAPRAAAEDEVK